METTETNSNYNDAEIKKSIKLGDGARIAQSV
jgi:hypothetical protein